HRSDARALPGCPPGRMARRGHRWRRHRRPRGRHHALRRAGNGRHRGGARPGRRELRAAAGQSRAPCARAASRRPAARGAAAADAAGAAKGRQAAAGELRQLLYRQPRGAGADLRRGRGGRGRRGAPCALLPGTPHGADRRPGARGGARHLPLPDAADSRPFRRGAASMSAVSEFIRRNFRHFNAAALVDAAEAYRRHVADGGKMLVALAGAMSTAELGLSLARMIRAGRVHAISCTGANLEEDIFNLVAHDHYVRVPHYRELSARDEQALFEQKLNRVTDTCIPEAEAFRRVEGVLLEEWRSAERAGERRFPHEFLYRILRSKALERYYQIDPADCWVLAACERDLPI